MSVKVLTRSERNRVLAGVFGGLGEYLNVDANILRLVGVILLILAPIAMAIVYTVAAFIIPRKSGGSYVSPTIDTSRIGPALVGLVLLVIGLWVMGSFPWSIFAWVFPPLSLAFTFPAGLVIAVIGLVLLIDQLRKI